MSFLDADRLVTEIAVAQHGVFASAQAAHAGLTERQRRHRVESGRWVRLAHGVFGLPGFPDSWDRQLWVAHLHARSAGTVACRSATLRHGVNTIDVTNGHPNDLITPRRSGRALEGTRRFRTDTLLPSEIVVIDGLPTTDPTRTLVDLSEVARIGRLEETAETFILTGRTTIEQLTATHERLRSPARPALMMQRLLDVIGPTAEQVGRSELERMLAIALERAGLPTPHWEYPLPTVTDMRAFVDCCWPDVRWIVEADGRRWHDRRRQADKDDARDLEAARLGYLTTRVRYSMLSNDLDGTVEMLLDVYRQRCADAGRSGRVGRAG